MPIPARLSWAYNAYGVILYNENKFEEAYPYETQAVQLNPNDEASQLNFALLCLELGKTDELNAAREKLVAMNSPQAEWPQVSPAFVTEPVISSGSTRRYEVACAKSRDWQ